jgi:hypothetical protein
MCLPDWELNARTIQLSPEEAAPKQLQLETVDSTLAAINARLAEIVMARKSVPQPVVEPKLSLRTVWQAILKKILRGRQSRSKKCPLDFRRLLRRIYGDLLGQYTEIITENMRS